MLSRLSPYVSPILTACFLFPVVAGLFTLPFLIMHYRKYGGIAFMRCVVVYSFILYSMCAFLLTVLPLPSREAVAAMPSRSIGWIPGNDLYVGFTKAGLSFSDPSTLTDFSLWKKFLLSGDVFQVLANIVMQIPLGFYLRYYFRCSLKKTILIGFCVSLFYELTQLSGLFFIYPKAYRYTEVDDLITNTLGAMAGYGITPLLARLLPSRDEIDRISYLKGSRITVFRRLVAMMLDMVIFALLYTMLMFLPAPLSTYMENHPLRYSLILFLFYYVLLARLMNGRTPGQWLLKLRLVDEDKHCPHWWRLLIRNFIIYFLDPLIAFFNLFAILALMLVLFREDSSFGLVTFAIGGCILLLGATILALATCIHRLHCLPHSFLSKTKMVSDRKHKPEVI